MKKLLYIDLGKAVAVLAMATLVFGSFRSPMASAVANNDFEPVTLCHFLGNGNYNEITVSTQGALQGHEGHEGDVIPAPEEGCESLEDEEADQATEADLEMTKTVDEPLPDIGGLITYGLKVKNNGPSDADNVQVMDVVPPGLTFLSADPAASYDANTGIWAIGFLPSGAEIFLDIYAQANLDAGDTAPVNTATVSSTTTDPDKENNVSSVVVQIGIPATCKEGPAFANQSVSTSQGTLKNGSAITDPDRIVVNYMLGETDNAFWSMGKGGDAVVGFIGYGADVVGPDITIKEVTNFRETYPEELADVYISQDGVAWVLAGQASSKNADGVTGIDIFGTGLTWFKFVKLEDATDFIPHTASADAFDIDSVIISKRYCAYADFEKQGAYNPENGEFTFEVNWEVFGQGQVNNLVIEDTILPGMTYVDGSATDGGQYDEPTNTLTWNLGSKSGGQSGSVSFKTTLDAFVNFNFWASSIVSADQGVKADLSTPVEANRSDATQALGPAESTGSAFDNPGALYTGKFYSLGFKDGADNGSIVLSFDSAVLNGAGNDVQIFEITGGTSYPDEKIRVEASNDNSAWTELGVLTKDGTVDLGGLSSALYIKLTGVSDIGIFSADGDEYDLDAVKRLHRYVDVCEVENIATATYQVGYEDIAVIDFEKSASVKVSVNQNTCSQEEDEDENGEDGDTDEDQLGSISGVVFEDTNENGIKDDGENDLSNWVVYIDQNDNGVLDGEEVSQTTASPYTFSGLADGQYFLREVVKDGWTQTGPVDNKYIVDIVSASTVTGKDFGNISDKGDNSGGGGTVLASGGGGGGGAVLIPTPTPTPQVLGAEAPTPGLPMPVVEGVATELPRTGAGALALLVPTLYALAGIFSKKKGA